MMVNERTHTHWLSEIERYNRASKKWRGDAKKTVDRYRLERSNIQGSRRARPTFNILWSNVQTLKPAMFSRTPEIIAERRHRDKDPVGRITAEVLERAANEEIERNGFKDTMDQVVLDVLLVGRGVPWVRFEADPLTPMDVTIREGDEDYYTEDGETADRSQVSKVNGRMVWNRDGMTNERTMLDYVHWDDFAHSPERNWADVERRGWVARRIALTKKEGIKRFGQKFKDVPLTMSTRTSETLQQSERSGGKDLYANVWEIWDVVNRKRIFVATDFSDIIEEEDDPYGLEGFFPCTRPAYATLTNEDLFPIPDYLQYLDLAEELDQLSWRIRKLTEALRLVGLYDASAEGLGKALDSGTDGKMVAVSNFSSLVGKSASAGGGLNGVVQWIPMGQVIETLLGLYSARDQAKDVLYEVSGISDIVRGQVDPREKATTSRIKAQFSSQRLEQRRRAVERTARDAARIQVEIIAELYDPATIREQSGFDFLPEIENLKDDEAARTEIWEQVAALIRSDKARGFRVDFETDSTVEMDAGQTQGARTEFLQSAGNFLNNALPVMQAAPDLVPVMGEMLLFTVRGYRAGRTLETSFEEAVQTLTQRLEQEQQAQEQQAQEPPQPDPEAQAQAARIQQQTEIEGAKGQAQIQRTQQQAQIEGEKGQIEIAKSEAELEAIIHHLRLENAELQVKLQQAASVEV